MSKYFLLLLIPSLAFAKGIPIKSDAEIQIPVGFVCYSPEEMNRLDIKQSKLLDCQTKLNAAETRLSAPLPTAKVETKKIYEKTWFQVTLGVILLGVGIGVGKAI